jgi:threonyl-tRNA synthetase
VEVKNLETLRHSAAHLLAAAVKQLWPSVKPTIGPPVENGFYYDFDFGKIEISEEDLPKIEKKMNEILPAWKEFKRGEVSPAEARKEFHDNPYKLELIEELVAQKEKVTTYQSGEFLDLCRGGHAENPASRLKNFKLLSIAGAYWRGDEKNPMLTRIYGTVFPTEKELQDYLKQLTLAKERDHRKLGKELDLFTFSDLVGAGLPLYTPKGALLRRLIFEQVESIQSRQGYHQVWTPQINKAELFKISGHYEKYKDSMFRVSSNFSKEELFLKPMNCPQHIQIYARKSHSYRDLPLRYTDFAMLYRDEKPGELLGLARTRAFSQDDCHIFCREDQVEEEVERALEMTKEVMKVYGFQYRYRLSTRDPKHPEKYLGDPQVWDKAEKWAEKIMIRNKIEHFNAPGEAAFYAPKMDLLATDSLGREWQLSTVQIDYVMPQRFGLTYADKDGKEKSPVMIHRAIVGSAERFLMVIIEHFGGEFPVWLSPVQAVIIPISEKFTEYGRKVLEELTAQGIRIQLDERGEKMQAKIRDAQIQKVPYMLVVGEREEKGNSAAVRLRDGKDLGAKKVAEIGNVINQVATSRIIDLWR